MTSDNVKTGLYVGAALLGAFAVYKVYKTGKDFANSFPDAVANTITEVENTAKSAYQKAHDFTYNAYAETRNFVGLPVSYSPNALDSSMSRQDAITLSYQLEAAANFNDNQIKNADNNYNLTIMEAAGIATP